ncbi:Cof-type HAD-IIB family hydrolase [Corynebacterium uropygiale]|uniref:Cof-type HAD-IIB family hydrolase n=1 Tax=Corynebacterium uropygiale TaxID=1775911 RepID=A0A9X1TZE4_9CORY|nr:Cof-type HAD-IIB family hydrolase [Corynebacterium uropygiale]MCF4006801.1 Cof-type HAD-IIB family hydrolase [Corynebacterium uropygiale]
MDYRLIACDMDGTLLDGEGRLPSGFDALYQRLHEAGIIFTPASGRQLATLQDMFGYCGEDMSYLAENGSVVVARGEISSITPFSPGGGRALLRAVEEHWAEGGRDLDIVICTPHCAYVRTENIAGREEIAKYYHNLEHVEDLSATIGEDLIKVAIYTRTNAENHIDVLRAAVEQGLGQGEEARAVVSGAHWIDVMNPRANKGRGLAELREALGVPAAQTMAFGDYLNDLELLEEAGCAWAMANAHPAIKEAADHLAPSCEEAGVIRVLEDVYGL